MILSCKDIHKSFGGIKAIQGCSFTVKKNKITAIIGPNGSGKTTMFNVISKLIDPDSGTIEFDGQDVTSLKDYELSKLGISRTFQDVKLFQNLTIREHLQIALSDSDERLLSNLFRTKDVESEKIQEVMEIVGLDKPLETYATDLSYGQRKLLDLAIGIAKPHSLLMLDEPVAGVNPRLRDSIKNILRELNNRGESILLIEHDMNFVMDLVDHIFVMDAGKVIAEGSPEEIQNDPYVLAAYLGNCGDEEEIECWT
ncbi:ABC transporter ATP-binding protein [Methanolobus bombayensis]|uniref:ABC transporter ATP-binding protein n=1 Tax=Methanolobus bombayensis TaxID=38023 RepID=UPI001AE37796|nr:ABC transporter ATP-binding protein [Methanolobus bombayensis]MBP1909435.1 ABC-type branched-subunit amino acid transport system ATPase component [Methanolobus bombayensis]